MHIENEEIYWDLKSYSKELGFADFGCAKAAPVSELVQENYLAAMNNGYFASMQYLHKNLEKRFNPRLLVEGACSVLVFLVPYSLPDNFTPPTGISQYALGEDYHKIIKEKLFLIMNLLRQRFPDFQGRAFTDSAPVLEREWGVRACLGTVGKNNFLISRKCGIKNFIATIICNIDIPATEEIEPYKKDETAIRCGECRRCLESCPTGALQSKFCIDARKCISYHTIENRNLSEDMEHLLVPQFGRQFFGCDSCLDACPWNSRNMVGWKEFHTNCQFLGSIDREWWFEISEQEFREKFKDSPLLRGGLKNIQTALEWGKTESNGRI